MNHYSPPECQEDAAACLLEGAAAHQLQHQHWVAAGDANSEPDPITSPVAAALATLGAHFITNHQPTTVNGSKAIDWFASSPHTKTVWQQQEQASISDHIPITLSIHQQNRGPLTRGRLKPAPQWHKPTSMSAQQWRQHLELAWETTSHTSTANQLNTSLQQEAQPQHMQQEWNLYMQLITKTYQAAVATAARNTNQDQQPHLFEELQAMKRHSRTKTKGLPAKHQWVSIPQPTGYATHEGEAARKQNRRLARLYEARRLAQHGKQPHPALLKKLWNLQPGVTLSQEQISQWASQDIAETISERNRQEDLTRKQRFQNWKQQLATPQGVAKWMRTKEEIPKGVHVHTNHQVAQDDSAAASHIAQFWHDFWEEHPNKQLDHQAAGQNLAHTIQQARGHQAVNWQPPTLQEFCQAAKAVKGAAGPDHWSSSEIRNLPTDCHMLMGRLFLRFLDTGCLPQQLKESRQVNLPKPGKIQNHQIDVAQTRPISVMSVFWRLFASAWINTASLQQFREAYIVDEVAGTRGGLGASDLAALLQNEYTNGGFLTSLDYTRCFDSLHPAITTTMWSTLGIPQQLCQLVHQAWGQHTRYVQWNQHTHDPPCQVSQGTPQGCPFAPFALNCWMAAGFHQVQSATRQQGLQPTCLQIYMDDRTFHSRSLSTALLQVDLWRTWSSEVGLQENQNKIQISGKTAAQQHLVVQHCPAAWIRNEVQFLGVTSTSTGRRRNAQTEDDRLKKALLRCQLLDAAKLDFSSLMRHFHKLVVPLMVYGWCSKKPTQRDSDRVFNKLTLASHTCRMANNKIRKAIYGGGLHLEAVWGTHLFRTVARLRSRGKLSWHNRAGSCVGLLRRWLKTQQWTEVRPWIWQSGRTQLHLDMGEIARSCHLVRQQWRQQQFLGWLHGHRHEAHQLLEQYTEPQLLEFFNEINWEATRVALMNGSAAERSVLLGAVTSPLWLHRGGHRNETGCCPWCDEPGHWMHMAWACQSRPSAVAQPRNPLEARFGWQSNRRHAVLQHRQNAVLQHLASIQQELWLARHGVSMVA